MFLLTTALLAQLGVAARQTPPVLAFPEAGVDDSASYQGYETRFYKDAARNTLQIYIERNAGRVVHVWANAENESIGFTARTARGLPAPIRWGGTDAVVSDSAGARTVQYRLAADAGHIHLGLFLLGSMRVERDFQHAARHREPLGARPFTLPESERLVAALASLAPAERRRHLALIAAPDVASVRRRLRPSITTRMSDSVWIGRVMQPALDGRDTLVLEIHADPRRVIAVQAGDSISLQARSGNRLSFEVRIASSAPSLTPLTREEIFAPEFLRFLSAAHAAGPGNPSASSPSGRLDSADIRARWLERQVRAVELLSSREKLMAGLPTYGTYFGRDMLVSALMMRSIWRDEMSEFVLAGVLRKLSPTGQVSHEEALGGQAAREAAAEYATLVDAHRAASRGGRELTADSLLARARETLASLRKVRENYHMIDDELHLAVLAARWLADSDVDGARKRAFLLDSADAGEPRVRLLLRELALIADATAAYADQPLAANLVSFAPRDSTGWASTSWRDSNAGYGGGRYAMDVNAIWVPHALESMSRILGVLRDLGIPADSIAASERWPSGAPLARYVRDPAALVQAIGVWRGARHHFRVRLGPAEVRTRVDARVAVMPDDERAYWRSRIAAQQVDRDSLEFLALALDAEGRPIAVANTDVATRLFLGEVPGGGAADRRDFAAETMRDVGLFLRPYPVGLFVDGVGPVVANDAYANPAVWRSFEQDPYHGPRVVWGREVNLFLLGVAQLAREAADDRLRDELQRALRRTLGAVEASGFQSELWSYEIEGARLMPVRYGTSSDIQLWSTTDLAVQFALSQLPR